ncbi:MAG: hypothetical protein JWP89_5403 [Schlesneria sp.]|nr:hypothetical protein [Schlesneria sp.]
MLTSVSLLMSWRCAMLLSGCRNRNDTPQALLGLGPAISGCGGFNAKARRRKDAEEESDSIRRYPPFFFASLRLRALTLKASIFQVVDFDVISSLTEDTAMSRTP